MEELQKQAAVAAAEHARVAEALQEAEERLAIVDSNNMSDIDRLDILARDTEALTKELTAARLHLASAHKDKHKVRSAHSPAWCTRIVISVVFGRRLLVIALGGDLDHARSGHEHR